MERCQIQNLEELKNLGGLDGLLCLGTFSKSMVRQIEAFKKSHSISGCYAKRRSV